MYLTRGWTSATWFGNGNQLYANAPSNLSKEPQGSITYLAPGDVVSFDLGANGHAAIVNTVNGTSVQLVNQNYGSDSNQQFYTSGTFSNGGLNVPDGTSVIGVIHAPASHHQRLGGDLVRYVNPSSYHFVSTGQVDATYTLESNLGNLALTPLPGTQALYSCHNGLDQFVSHDPGCEGATRLPPAPMGYAFSAAPPGLPSQAIYRCHGGADHFVTTDPNCEGAGTNEGLLGYTIAETSLGRYVNSSSYHFVTTGQVDASYNFEFDLGLLALTALPGTQVLYSCHNGLDQFVSMDPGCEGATKLPPAPMGYAFNSPPAHLPSQAIFRCHGGADHFVTTDPNCEGAGTNEGQLGYTIAETSLSRYVNPSSYHFVTTGQVDASYAFESDLGFLTLTPLPGMQVLYSCHNGLDQFVSPDSACEGATRLPPAPMGYAFNAAPAGVPSQAIYRCHGGADHFVTSDPNCEGAGTNEGRLGYTMVEPGVVIPTTPAAPVGVSATPGNAQATIVWGAPSSDGGSGIISYSVAGNPGGSATLTCPCGTLQVVIGGLTNGTSYTFTVTANNMVGAGPASSPSNAVIPVSGPIVISPSTLPNGTAGRPYSVSLSATGGTAPYSFTLSAGSLPAGLSLSSAGTISGTPSNAGSFTFQVTATDSSRPVLITTETYTIKVVLKVSPSKLPRAQHGTHYSVNLTVSGGTSPYTWTLVSGALPPGLSLSAPGTISGIPTTAGTFTFKVKVVDSSHPHLRAVKTYTITVS